MRNGTKLLVLLSALFSILSLCIGCEPLQEPDQNDPFNLSAHLDSFGTIRLTWTTPESLDTAQFQKMEIYRSTTPNFDYQTPGNITLYSSENPEAGSILDDNDGMYLSNQTYYYRLYAFYTDGSNRASAVAELNPFCQVIFIVCRAVTEGQFNIYMMSDNGLTLDVIENNHVTLDSPNAFHGAAFDGNRYLYLFYSAELGSLHAGIRRLDGFNGFKPDESFEIIYDGLVVRRGLGFYDGFLYHWNSSTASGSSPYKIIKRNAINQETSAYDIPNTESTRACTVDGNNHCYLIIVDNTYKYLAIHDVNLGSSMSPPLVITPTSIENPKEITVTCDGTWFLVADYSNATQTYPIKRFNRDGSSGTSTVYQFDGIIEAPVGIAFAN